MPPSLSTIVSYFSQLTPAFRQDHSVFQKGTFCSFSSLPFWLFINCCPDILWKLRHNLILFISMKFQSHITHLFRVLLLQVKQKRCHGTPWHLCHTHYYIQKFSSVNSYFLIFLILFYLMILRISTKSKKTVSDTLSFYACFFNSVKTIQPFIHSF